jgi:S1-C subfamily serine protease
MLNDNNSEVNPNINQNSDYKSDYPSESKLVETNNNSNPTFGQDIQRIAMSNLQSQSPITANQNSQPNSTQIEYSKQNAAYQTHQARVRIQEDPESHKNYKVRPNRIKSIILFFSIFALTGAILASIVFGLSYFWPQQFNNRFLSSLNKKSNSSVTKSLDNRNNLAFANQKDSMSTVDVVNQNLPAVVSINVTSKVDNRSTAGSGFVVSSDGLIISNKHVVSFACVYGKQNLKISALTQDQKVYNLELKSIDPVDDIAILKMVDAPSNLAKVEFGDSSKLQLGEDVIAIGNALGNLQNTVTKGVVSGLDRSFDAQNLKDECTNSELRVDSLIQTDAAINKGNSGGPLFNSSGQIIGMNTLGTDAQSVGLAIPSATLLTVLNSYLVNQTIIRARLGVVTQEISPLRKIQKPWLPVDYGEFVGGFDGNATAEKVVAAGSAAEESGIKFGDIILEINGQKLVASNYNPSPLRRSVLNKQVGDVIEITVLQGTIDQINQKVSYASQPTKVKVKLKGVNYNLDSPTRQL